MNRTLAISTACLTGLLLTAYTSFVPAQRGGGFGDAQARNLGAGMNFDPAECPADGSARRGPGGPGGGPGGPGMDGPGGPGGPGGGPGAGLPFDGPRMHRLGEVLLFPFWQNTDIVTELGLTDDQVKSLDESLKLTQDALDGSEGSIREAGQALRDEMEKDTPDGATATQLLTELNAARDERGQIFLSHAVLVKSTLTEEQEDALPRLVRDLQREYSEEIRQLRHDIMKTIRDGGTIDDIKALIDAAGLPAPLDEIALRRAEKALEWYNNRPAPSPTPTATSDGSTSTKSTSATSGWRSRLKN